LLSWPDSLDPYRSMKMSLGSVRFLLAALALGVLLQSAQQRGRFLQLASLLIVFWCVDAYWQLWRGVDLLGIPMDPERLNALFERPEAFGPTLALVSPLLLETLRRRAPSWAWALGFSLVLGAVLVSGMRAAWLMAGLLTLFYFVTLLRSPEPARRRLAVALPGLVFAVGLVTAWASPTVQERWRNTLELRDGTLQALDQASSYRLPIFHAALDMYAAHPVNGVGVRAFGTAYPAFARANDPHVAKGEPASHAHNIVLEVIADSGSIGLLGLAGGLLFGWRAWRSMPAQARVEARPYVLALALALFPLNSYFSIYGSYTSTLLWFFVGLWAACLPSTGTGDAPAARE
ncbi:MAG: O-antigen ligase family protein, partial [Xanthomonadales bacterium]|nr:O-antigen ligase family protein [Xanthomonadales bacterium]